MYNLVACCVCGDDVVLLVALLLKGTLCVLHIVLFFLRNLLLLLAILALVQCREACFESFKLALNGLQLCGASCLAVFENLLNERMVAIKYEIECVGHLCVECHASLEFACLFHSAHILALCDEYRQSLFAESLHVYVELGLFHLRQL